MSKADDFIAELSAKNQALKAENQKLLNQLVYIHELSPIERRAASETALREKIDEMQTQRMKYEIDSAEERGAESMADAIKRCVGVLLTKAEMMAEWRKRSGKK